MFMNENYKTQKTERRSKGPEPRAGGPVPIADRHEAKGNIMKANETKKTRTTKLSTTVIIAFLTLIVGVVFGAASAENGTGLVENPRPGAAPTNKTATTSVATPATGQKTGAMTETDPFAEIRDLQTRMDRSFDEMFQQLYAKPQFNLFKDNPGYSLALDVRDLKDHYEVRAYLPDTKNPDVQVNLKNGQTLDVNVTSKKMTKTSDAKNGTSEVSELGQYEQMIELPSPVKSGQMKIKHEGQELVITIPKA